MYRDEYSKANPGRVLSLYEELLFQCGQSAALGGTARYTHLPKIRGEDRLAI